MLENVCSITLYQSMIFGVYQTDCSARTLTALFDQNMQIRGAECMMLARFNR